jgi:AraC family transcriptional activator of mtrCDE
MALRAPLIWLPETQLRQLMQVLEIDFVRLTECVVSPGWRLAFGGSDVASVHYNFARLSKVAVEGQAPIVLESHTLVIFPLKRPFRFEVDGPQGTLTNPSGKIAASLTAASVLERNC